MRRCLVEMRSKGWTPIFQYSNSKERNSCSRRISVFLTLWVKEGRETTKVWGKVWSISRAADKRAGSSQWGTCDLDSSTVNLHNFHILK